MITGDQVFAQAWKAWNDASVPAYESFTLPCHELVPNTRCGDSTRMRVTMRTSDGQARVVTIPKAGEPAQTLMAHGILFGPAYAPLGFVKRVGGATPQRVGSLASDPFGSPETIAAVTATALAYDIALTNDTCGGSAAYHLVLTPHGDPHTHPLRQLWVDATSFRICRLVYGMRYHGAEATVTYGFTQIDAAYAPTITSITARVPERSIIGVHFVESSETLDDIAFPATSDLP